MFKNLLAVAVLLPLVLGRGGFGDPGSLLLLALSGVVGIAAGDSFYSAALRRLGTRRILTIDAAGPAVAALGGAFGLAELPAAGQWFGLALITVALLLVAWQRPEAGRADGGELQGLVMALAALLCGTTGALLSRAALRIDGLDPFGRPWCVCWRQPWCCCHCCVACRLCAGLGSWQSPCWAPRLGSCCSRQPYIVCLGRWRWR